VAESGTRARARDFGRGFGPLHVPRARSAGARRSLQPHAGPPGTRVLASQSECAGTRAARLGHDDSCDPARAPGIHGACLFTPLFLASQRRPCAPQTGPKAGAAGARDERGDLGTNPRRGRLIQATEHPSLHTRALPSPRKGARQYGRRRPGTVHCASLVQDATATLRRVHVKRRGSRLTPPRRRAAPPGRDTRTRYHGLQQASGRA